MADSLILDDAEFDALRAQVRNGWRRQFPGSAIPDALTLSAIATRKDKTARIYSAATFAEPPEWAPFLPVAGVYEHPWYGTLQYDLTTYQRIVDHFHGGIYQSQLPVNAEHDPQASGAVGWITDLRINADTSIDAKVEWNDRGKALIEGDRYRYVSAELWDEWTDPVSGTTYQDVAIGLAICTNPFFKESVLRPLAASDAVWTYRPESSGQEVTGMNDAQKQAASGVEPQAVTLSEAELQEFRDAKKRADTLAVELTAAKAQLETTTADLAKVRTAQRVAAFTAEVRGKSDDNGKPWPGAVDAHVAMLTSLAEAFGEDSEQFRQYVAVNRAAAARDELTKPIGSGGDGNGTASAYSQLEAKAAALVAERGLTKAKAFVEAERLHPDLARQVIRERRSNVVMEGAE